MKKMLHRILLLAAALVCQGSISAYGAESLSELLSKISKGKLLKADFSCVIKYKQKTYSSSGTIKFQDGAYYLDTDALVIADNGQDCWSVDRVSKEVVIEPSEGIAMLSGASITPSYGADGALKALEAVLKDGTKATVKIPKIELLPKLDNVQDTFSYDDSGLDSSWVVTDLR